MVKLQAGSPWSSVGKSSLQLEGGHDFFIGSKSFDWKSLSNK
jgi:hypothetical protein